ncbi:hypothetical protein ACHGLA_00705 [Streptomyces sp. YH02]|uniref:hypothetical protein n=1 Tax=Streptomyces sp. YH02 TaxID=3256999 RepID=UPI003756F7BD
MRERETPSQAGSGLSTEDIAQQTGRGTAEETGRGSQDDRQNQDRGQDRERDGNARNAPVYPGESTAIGDTADADEKQESSAPEAETPAQATVETRAQAAAEPAADKAAAEETAAEEQADVSARLLDSDDEASFRTRWSDIQSMFVDDPRQAVQAADALVADVMQQLATTFADHKRNLEGQWGEDDHVNTESLRMALRQYRSFFNRLLSQ